ncbi:integrase core domain-containing protein, partial [Streptomyces sp. NPDC046900]|uniref:integrase core domain-containing protein n=1 Tax=Streptomyces sp. NPDC046900 TaxID=3155473 RepID=UPI0033C8167B
MGVTQSMGRVGSCFDNAVSESFNSVLKVEYVDRHTFATRTEARLKIATWITGFYNTHRLHSVCGYRSPIDYEHDHRANPVLELAALSIKPAAVSTIFPRVRSPFTVSERAGTGGVGRRREGLHVIDGCLQRVLQRGDVPSDLGEEHAALECGEKQIGQLRRIRVS